MSALPSRRLPWSEGPIRSGPLRKEISRPIADFPLGAIIVADFRFVFRISPAVEIAPEKRTVASAPVSFGVQQRAGPSDAALDVPVAGVLIYRPCRANANLGQIRTRHRRCRQRNGKHPTVIRVPDPFEDQFSIGDGDRGKKPVVLYKVDVVEEIPRIDGPQEVRHHTARGRTSQCHDQKNNPCGPCL